MYDDDDKDYDSLQGHLANDKLVREGGVFIEPQHSEVDCNQEAQSCGPDDYPEDPYAIDNRPGTPDDLGYTWGVEIPGDAGADKLGQDDADELWSLQEPLIEEDVDDGIKMPAGVSAEDARRILDAMGDEAAEVLPEASEGVSATGGDDAGEGHGGFPERDD